MNRTELPLRGEERISLTLRALYATYGYAPYKMSKFEDYSLYADNKDFLVSDHIITFNDIGGRLMALKPDVTLSIVKNDVDRPGSVRKVYYDENVYRVSARTHRFSEIRQTGLECIGDLDDYCIGEVLMLAARSLRTVSENAVLDLSHLGVVSALLARLTVSDEVRRGILRRMGEKNVHELASLCKENNVDAPLAAALCRLVTTYGDPDSVLPALKNELSALIDPSPIDELARAVESLPADLRAIVRIDFSVVSDPGYYNGIVFKGFVPGAPGSVLSGGRYDSLLRKLGRTAGAIGFAVYMDELERLDEASDRFDVDVVLLYGDCGDPAAVRAAVEGLTANGERVSALKTRPDKLRCRRVLRLTQNGEVTEDGSNA